MAAGELITSGNLMALGTWVCAALITSGVEPGVPPQGAGIAFGPQSIGSGSPMMQARGVPFALKPQRAGSGVGQTSPTKSYPPTTFAVGNRPSSVVLRGSEVVVP